MTTWDTRNRQVRLVDITLRDRSHAMAHRFTEANVRDTVRALDDVGVSLIEVAHRDGLGGSVVGRYREAVGRRRNSISGVSARFRRPGRRPPHRPGDEPAGG